VPVSASLLRTALLAFVALFVAGCATVPAGAGLNPADPWEAYNRHMFEFNDRVDRALIRPVAQFYGERVPEPVRACLGNVVNNLSEAPSALNNLLQGKPAAAVADLCRLVINSTVGLLGCFDIAAKMGLARTDEDFGQTLGRWGAGPGPYFVLPLLGPSSVRDAVGRFAGFYVDPLDLVQPNELRYSLTGLRVIDARARLLPAERVLRAAALDWYAVVRHAYLSSRQNLVYDGDPPRELEDPGDDAQPSAPKSPTNP